LLLIQLDQALVFRQVFLLGEQVAMILCAPVHGFNRVCQQEFVLFRFGGVGGSGVFQGVQFRLELRVGLEDQLQGFADVVLAVGNLASS